MDNFFWVMVALAVGYVLGRNSVLRMDGETRTPMPVGELPAEAKGRMEDALRRGDKIDAIRIVRTATGAGLKESKAFVDAFAAKRAERRKGDPIGH